MITDLFITIASWEDRFLLSFNQNIESFDPKTILIIQNDDKMFRSEVEFNKKQFENKAQLKGIKVITIIIDFFNPEKIWNGLKENLICILKPKMNITIDISTTTRELLWYLLYFTEPRSSTLNFIYHSPAEYNNEWLSRDPVTPRLLFRHSGISQNNKKTALIVLTGYDDGRVKQLIHYYEPYSTFLFLQPNEDERSSKNYQIFRETYNVIHENINNFHAKECYSTLKSCYEENQDLYNFIVTSLGPKIGALQVYKLIKEFPSIALCYAPSKEYNKSYSKGIGDFNIYQYK